MAESQAEPFYMAANYLRDRLQRGELPPGSRITAVELADTLRLSTTPVREALSRLAGEDLLEERRGQGYFVRLLSAADIADLYRVSLAHLLIAGEPRRPERSLPPTSRDADVDPQGAVEVVEALFRRWLAGTGSRFLYRSFRLVQVQLGAVRRLEAGMIPDLADEAGRLAGLEGASRRSERLAQLRQFHARRIREAEGLAARLEAASTPPRK